MMQIKIFLAFLLLANGLYAKTTTVKIQDPDPAQEYLISFGNGDCYQPTSLHGSTCAIQSIKNNQEISHDWPKANFNIGQEKIIVPFKIVIHKVLYPKKKVYYKEFYANEIPDSLMFPMDFRKKRPTGRSKKTRRR